MARLSQGWWSGISSAVFSVLAAPDSSHQPLPQPSAGGWPALRNEGKSPISACFLKHSEAQMLLLQQVPCFIHEVHFVCKLGTQNSVMHVILFSFLLSETAWPFHVAPSFSHPISRSSSSSQLIRLLTFPSTTGWVPDATALGKSS